MNNRELQDILARYPDHLPVMILLAEVCWQDGDDPAVTLDLEPSDALEADRVIYEGGFLLIESK